MQKTNFTEKEAATALGVPETVLVRWRELGAGPASVASSKCYRRSDAEAYLTGLAYCASASGDPDLLAKRDELRKSWPDDAILSTDEASVAIGCHPKHVAECLFKAVAIPSGFTYSAQSLVEFLEIQYCSEARKKLAELRASGVLPAEPGAPKITAPKHRSERVYAGLAS